MDISSMLSGSVSGPLNGAQQSEAQRTQAIEKAATGMESMFASLLLKQMRQTLEPGSMFASDNGDVLGGLFDATMGDHLAKSNGLGIGNMLKQQWAKQYQQVQTPASRTAVGRSAALSRSA